MEELLTKLRSLPVTTADVAICTLKELLGPQVNVRYEVLGGCDNTKNKRAYGHLVNAQLGRILLSSNKMIAGKKSPDYCNGLLLEYPTWRVLALPPKAIIPKNITPRLNLQNYNIYNINDGTIVTLYWYEDKWCLSSANGFEVSNFYWLGDKTYGQALAEVANIDYAALDKNKSYTVGFRHHGFHPLLADPQGAWFIISSDLESLNGENPKILVSTNDTGLPSQKLVTPSYNEIAETTLSAYDGYLRFGKIHYGYILRAKDGSSDIMIESSLLRKIRQMLYNIPKNKVIKNKLEFVILRAFLSRQHRFAFRKLFPQYEKQLTHYEAQFGKLTLKIVSALRSKNARIAILKNSPSVDGLNALAVFFINHIESQTQLNANDPMIASIIEDYIIDGKYLDMYTTYFVR